MGAGCSRHRGAAKLDAPPQCAQFGADEPSGCIPQQGVGERGTPLSSTADMKQGVLARMQTFAAAQVRRANLNAKDTRTDDLLLHYCPDSPFGKITNGAMLEAVLDKNLLEEIRSGVRGDFEAVRLMRLVHYNPDFKPRFLRELKDFMFWFQEPPAACCNCAGCMDCGCGGPAYLACCASTARACSACQPFMSCQAGQQRHQFWSENHMIAYLSSQWLAWELWGFEIFPDGDAEKMKNRLVKYLDLKLKYGFYEFFSSTYLPYTIMGLLNLSDFAKDTAIQEMSTKAAQKALRLVLAIASHDGVYLTVSGRDYTNKLYYEQRNSRQFEPVIYLLTGRGDVLLENCDCRLASFLCCSKLEITKDMYALFDVDGPLPPLCFGHSARQLKQELKDLPRDDRAPFIFSQGGYVSPDHISETLWFIRHFNLWGHKVLKPFRAVRCCPSFCLVGISCLASKFTRGPVLSKVDVAIWKHKSVVLASTQRYNEQLHGAQQVVWVANVAGMPVFAQSGRYEGWLTPRNMRNHCLPRVEQWDHRLVATYGRWNRKAGPTWISWPFASNVGTCHRYVRHPGNRHFLFGRYGDAYVGIFYRGRRFEPQMHPHHPDRPIAYLANARRVTFVVEVGFKGHGATSFPEFQALFVADCAPKAATQSRAGPRASRDPLQPAPQPAVHWA